MPNWLRFIFGVLVWLGVQEHCPAAADPQPLLKADFARDPLVQGWELRACGTQPFGGGWNDVDGMPGSRCLTVRLGYWQSPSLAVGPLHYYRLRFSARSESAGFWAAVFLDADGKELAADAYDQVCGSKDWAGHTFCFRAHAAAARVWLRFQAVEKPLQVGRVVVEQVDCPTVAAWADEIAAACPLVTYEPPEQRCRLLPRTMATLEKGGLLRIVMLGDSICNDTSNSLYETLLNRVYPKAQIEVTTSIRSGTGCQYYKEDHHVQEYVLRFKPDLVIIAGISHDFDAESIRSVIRQIRAGSKSEILLLSGAICPAEEVRQGYFKRCGLPLGKYPCRIS